MEFRCVLNGKPPCEHQEVHELPEDMIDTYLTPEQHEYYNTRSYYKCIRVRTDHEEKFEGWLGEYPCPLALKIDEKTGYLLELPIFFKRIQQCYNLQENLKQSEPPKYFGIDS